MLRLIKPAIEHLEAIECYCQEFIEEGRTWIDGSAGIMNYPNLEDWLIALKNNGSEATVAEGLVPSTLFLGIREEDNQLVGMVDIRHRLNEYLLNFGGHIGYGVRHSERRKGYATELLRLALEESKNLEIKEVLLTCDKSNIASAKTILANQGVFENEIQNGEKLTQRYWIK